MDIFISGVPTNQENVMYVTFIHRQPFHEETGLTPEDIALGYLVESIPNPEPPKGKVADLMFNTVTKELWYNYDRNALPPPVSLEELNEKIELLLQMQLESEGIL